MTKGSMKVWMKGSMWLLLVGIALGGCVDLEGEPGGDDPTGAPSDGTEDDGAMDDDLAISELALAQSHHSVKSFGGSIFSQPFLYVSQQNDPAGACSPGTIRPAQPVVQWVSSGGGYCQFAGWSSSDPHDCRATIIGSTGGGWFGGDCHTWVYEVPDTVPNPTGSFSYNAANTGSATTNTVNYAIVLGATQTLTVGTCGVPGASFSGDTYLRLYDPYGTLVASNDDACGGLGSSSVYTSTVGGAFQIRAGCYSNSTCSGTVAWTIR